MWTSRGTWFWPMAICFEHSWVAGLRVLVAPENLKENLGPRLWPMWGNHCGPLWKLIGWIFGTSPIVYGAYVLHTLYIYICIYIYMYIYTTLRHWCKMECQTGLTCTNMTSFSKSLWKEVSCEFWVDGLYLVTSHCASGKSSIKTSLGFKGKEPKGSLTAYPWGIKHV